MSNLFLMLSRAMGRSQSRNSPIAAPADVPPDRKSEQEQEVLKRLAEQVAQLRRENHSIRARLSAVQDQIQEVNQINEILLFVQQQILSNIGAAPVDGEIQAIIGNLPVNDDDVPN